MPPQHINSIKRNFKIGDKIRMKSEWINHHLDVSYDKTYEIHHIRGGPTYCFIDDRGDDHYCQEDEITLVSNDVVTELIDKKISEYQAKIRAIDIERADLVENVRKLTDALGILLQK